MKTCIALALFIVGINSLPTVQNFQNAISMNNERFVTDAIASAIEDVSQSIRDRGLDPLYIQHDTGDFGLPVPVIFNVEGVLDNFLFHGLSDIVINSMSYSLFTNRLRMEITLPLIEARMNRADAVVTLFGKEYRAASSGRFAIRGVNVNADIRVNIGIISGISIRSIDLLFKLGGIDSELTVVVAGFNLSNRLNTFLGGTIPNTLNNFEGEVNELLEIVALDFLNANL